MILFLLFLSGTAHDLNFEHAAIFGGVDLGYYYVDLRVGTPPMKQTVIVDTGSSLTAFPCSGCQSCGTHMDSYFDYRLSNTSRLVTCTEGVECNTCHDDKCQYHQGYAEGSSIAGFLVEDFVQFGDDTVAEKVKFIFGCHNSETNLFRTQLADGIIGLAFSQESKRRPTIVDVLYQSHGITTNVFALCLGLQDGYMTIGGFNTSMHTSELKTAKLYDSIYYSVKLQGIAVNQTPVDLHPSDFGVAYTSGTIIDSGTTFAYLSRPVYAKLWASFENFCSTPGNCLGSHVGVSGEQHTCYRHSDGTLSDFFQSFPTFYLNFDNITVPWEPASYLFSWPDKRSDFCMGIYDNGGGGSVLGGIFMRGMDIVFDREADTISFAKSECNATYILSGGRKEEVKIEQPPAKVVRQVQDETWKWLVGLVLGLLLAMVAITGLYLCCCKTKNLTQHVEMSEQSSSDPGVVVQRPPDSP